MNAFDDLLAANRSFAESLPGGELSGKAQAGVCIVTCMDCRIDPLRALGLGIGDAKVVRNPGGQVNPEALQALILAVHLLGCDKLVIMPHTKCAMGSKSENEFRAAVGEAAGTDASWQDFMAVADQRTRLEEDVRKVQAHPLIPDTVAVGGFVYDVDSGLLEQVV